MLPVQTPERTYSTLEEIRQRKDELLDSLQQDNQQFTRLWNSVFTPKKESSRAEFIGSIVTHGVTAVDAFLLVRKLLKSYSSLFGRKKR